MTKLQIIRRLWSVIYDLLLYIQEDSKRKSLDEIEDELDLLERACRRYGGVDEGEMIYEDQQPCRQCAYKT
nr:hypothetical protein [uncultured Blautia sp.]